MDHLKIPLEEGLSLGLEISREKKNRSEGIV
jgi:hypothetical protein